MWQADANRACLRSQLPRRGFTLNKKAKQQEDQTSKRPKKGKGSEAMTASFSRPAVQPARWPIDAVASDQVASNRSSIPRLCFAILASVTFAMAPSPLRAQTASPVPKVSTSLGAIEGMRRDSVDAFFGIPYALPPTGERRLAPPVQASAWTEPLRATIPPSACRNSRHRILRDAPAATRIVFISTSGARRQRPADLRAPGR
jgi:Carboxylesterase family